MGFDNATIARRLFKEVWGEGRSDSVDELVDPEIVVRDTLGTDIKGIDKVKAMVEEMRSIFSDNTFTIEEVIVAGDRVVVRHTWSGTHRGSFFGAPGSGRTISTQGCEVLRIANGKVVEEIGYMDLYSLLEQVDRVPRRDQLEKPTRMKAVAVDRFGGPRVLHTATLPVPEPGEHEIVLRVDTAGIGVWDPAVREGELDDGSTRFPYVMGNDGAGVVVAVGPKVRRLHVGDHAYGYQMEGGFYAEYVKLDEGFAAPIPKGLDEKEAGAVGADGITALRGLEDQLRLRSGQSIMIIGASGGIGHMAVQLAKRLGARVLAVASRPDGVKLVERLGADVAIDGRKENIASAAREFAPDGLDAALVLAGGADVNRALKAVKRGGRIAYPNGVEPEPKAPKGVKLLPYDGTPSAEAFDRLNDLIGDTPFHVELGKVYDLEQVARAHRELGRHHLGKYALRVH